MCVCVYVWDSLTGCYGITLFYIIHHPSVQEVQQEEEDDQPSWTRAGRSLRPVGGASGEWEEPLANGRGLW